MVQIAMAIVVFDDNHDDDVGEARVENSYSADQK